MYVSIHTRHPRPPSTRYLRPTRVSRSTCGQYTHVHVYVDRKVYVHYGAPVRRLPVSSTACRRERYRGETVIGRVCSCVRRRFPRVCSILKPLLWTDGSAPCACISTGWGSRRTKTSSRPCKDGRNQGRESSLKSRWICLVFLCTNPELSPYLDEPPRLYTSLFSSSSVYMHLIMSRPGLATACVFSLRRSSFEFTWEDDEHRCCLSASLCWCSLFVCRYLYLTEDISMEMLLFFRKRSITRPGCGELMKGEWVQRENLSFLVTVTTQEKVVGEVSARQPPLASLRGQRDMSRSFFLMRAEEVPTARPRECKSSPFPLSLLWYLSVYKEFAYLIPYTRACTDIHTSIHTTCLLQQASSLLSHPGPLGHDIRVYLHVHIPVHVLRYMYMYVHTRRGSSTRRRTRDEVVRWEKSGSDQVYGSCRILDSVWMLSCRRE